MSKTSVGVMQRAVWDGSASDAAPASLSAGEYAGRQVPVAAIADDEHDGRVLDFTRDAQRDRTRAPRRYAGEDAFHARELPRGFFCVGLRHRFEAVDAFGVVDPGQVLDRPFADSRDLRAFL